MKNDINFVSLMINIIKKTIIFFSDILLLIYRSFFGSLYQGHVLSRNILSHTLDRTINFKLCEYYFDKVIKTKNIILKNKITADLASNENYWAIYLAKKNPKTVHAIEISKKIYNRGNFLLKIEKLKNILNRKYDFTKNIKTHNNDILKFPYEKLDFVLIPGVFYHLTSEEQFNLIKIITKFFKEGIISTMIFNGTEKMNNKEYTKSTKNYNISYSDEYIVIFKDKKTINDKSSLMQSKDVLWPSRDYLKKIFLNENIYLEEIEEEGFHKKLDLNRNDSMIIDKAIVGYHDFYFKNNNLF